MCKLRFYVIVLIIKGDVRLLGYRSVFFHEVTEKQDKFSDVTGERKKSNVNWFHAAQQFINTSFFSIIFILPYTWQCPMAIVFVLFRKQGTRSKALEQISAEDLSTRKKKCRGTGCLRLFL